MGLMRMFKMLKYLMNNENAFAVVVAALRDHKTLQLEKTEHVTVMPLEGYGPYTMLKHPETLIIGMACYLGGDVTWTILVGILQTHMPDFNVVDLHAFGLKSLDEYDRCDNGEIKKALLASLSDVREEDLERVKLLLLWDILSDYNHVPLGCIEKSSPRRLTEQILSKYSDHAVCVMSLIFTHIRRQDLVEKLTAAAKAYPPHTGEQTHKMRLSRMFKMVNYLMGNQDAFAIVVADIQDHQTPPLGNIRQIALMLMELGRAMLKHPDTLVHGMCCYMGHNVTWDILLGILRTCPEFNIVELDEHGLEKLERYDMCDNVAIKGVILHTLLSLGEAELTRVKLLLSWEIVLVHGHIPLKNIQESSPHRLTDQILTKYSNHAVYAMAQIFALLRRMDLVAELTAAAQVQRTT